MLCAVVRVGWALWVLMKETVFNRACEACQPFCQQQLDPDPISNDSTTAIPPPPPTVQWPAQQVLGPVVVPLYATTQNAVCRCQAAFVLSNHTA